MPSLMFAHLQNERFEAGAQLKRFHVDDLNFSAPLLYGKEERETDTLTMESEIGYQPIPVNLTGEDDT